MGRRARKEETLEDRAVTSPVRAATPEVPQRRAGTWNVWPVLRDPQTPAAIERGDLDDVIDELRGYATAHDATEVTRAIDARKGTM